MNTITIDIETSGLELDSTIYSNAIKINDDPTECYTYRYISNGDGPLGRSVKAMREADLIVSFNGIGFDMRVLEHKYGKIDTPHLDLIILSKLMFTKDQLFDIDRGIANMPKDLNGSFSLKAFGYRLGCHKDSYDDWSKLTTDMVEYNKQDVEVTHKLYKFLSSRSNYPSKEVIDLEHEVARIMGEQEFYGFYFDLEKARELNASMLKEQFTLKTKIQKQFKPMFLPDGPEKVTNKVIKRKVWLPTDTIKFPKLAPWEIKLKAFKNGKWKFPPKSTTKFFSTPHKLMITEKQGALQDIKLQRFEGTDNQILRWLDHMYGFTFTGYTEKGNMRVDRDELEELGEYGVDLRRMMKLKKDISQLGGTERSLIARCRTNNTVTSRIDTNGTNTGRFTSSGGSVGVNLNQIPSSESFRRLFSTPNDDWVFIGTDFSGQENVVLAELLYKYDDGRLDSINSTGEKSKGTDLHSINGRACEIPRGDAKPVWFGKLYGASSTLTGYTLLGRKDYSDYTSEEFSRMEDKLHKRSVVLPNGNRYYPIKKGQLVLFNEQLVKQALYGELIQGRLVKSTTGLQQLEADLAKDYKKNGGVTTLGGRFIPVDSPHKMLNYSCQGQGGEAMKMYIRIVHRRFKEAGLVHGRDFIHQATIYDEIDMIAKKEHTTTITSILDTSYTLVSRELNMKCTFEGETLVGNDWYDCH